MFSIYKGKDNKFFCYYFCSHYKGAKGIILFLYAIKKRMRFLQLTNYIIHLLIVMIIYILLPGCNLITHIDIHCLEGMYISKTNNKDTLIILPFSETNKESEYFIYTYYYRNYMNKERHFGTAQYHKNARSMEFEEWENHGEACPDYWDEEDDKLYKTYITNVNISPRVELVFSDYNGDGVEGYGYVKISDEIPARYREKIQKYINEKKITFNCYNTRNK